MTRLLTESNEGFKRNEALTFSVPFEAYPMTTSLICAYELCRTTLPSAVVLTSPAAMELESQDKDLTTDDLSSIQLLVPIQAVAIGCHHHICRQQTEGRDELFKALLQQLSKFYLELRVMLEGGKITPLMRARSVFRRLQRIIKRD